MQNFPPGPQTPFFGLPLANRFRSKPLEFLTEMGRTYGDLSYFRMGPYRAAFVNHPNLIRDVLVTRAKLFPKQARPLEALRKIDGDGLVISDGDLWQRQRRLVQPSFHPSRIGKYVAMMAELTGRRLAGWKAGETLDMAKEMTSLTLTIIAKTLFDAEISGEAARLGEAVHIISETVTRELGQPFQLPDWVPIPSKRRKRWAIKTLDALIRGQIRARRASGEDRGDVLSMLLFSVDPQSRGGMSDELARDEAMTLFNAGHDTTAAALAWVWYLVTSHPAVEAALVEEERTVLGGKAPALETLPKLRYTEMVVKEAMRLYPPAWILFAREAASDVPLGKHVVPKGTWIYLSPYVTQRDPRFFEAPETFDPGRWEPGRVEKIAQYAYFPFGGGPRVCIGSQFAINEMKVILPMVLARFRLRLASPERHVEAEPLLALRPKGGLPIRVSLR